MLIPASRGLNAEVKHIRHAIKTFIKYLFNTTFKQIRRNSTYDFEKSSILLSVQDIRDDRNGTERNEEQWHNLNLLYVPLHKTRNASHRDRATKESSLARRETVLPGCKSRRKRRRSRKPVAEGSCREAAANFHDGLAHGPWMERARPGIPASA